MMKAIQLFLTMSLTTLLLTTGCQTHKPEDLSREEVLSQIQEALRMVSNAKIAVTEYRGMRGEFPVSNKTAGLPEPKQLIGNYVTSVTVKNGAIHIALGNRADSRLTGKILTLRLAYAVDNMHLTSWLCGYAEPVQGMVAQGENLTSVPKFLLPQVCLAYSKP